MAFYVDFKAILVYLDVALIDQIMKFGSKYQGKWVAAKDDKIIAGAASLGKLIQKVERTEDPKNLKFSLVPKGFISGSI